MHDGRRGLSYRRVVVAVDGAAGVVRHRLQAVRDAIGPEAYFTQTSERGDEVGQVRSLFAEDRQAECERRTRGVPADGVVGRLYDEGAGHVVPVHRGGAGERGAQAQPRFKQHGVRTRRALRARGTGGVVGHHAVHAAQGHAQCAAQGVADERRGEYEVGFWRAPEGEPGHREMRD